MFDLPDDFLELFSDDQPHFLRVQALDLFDRGLTENDASLIVAFVERQLAEEPPPLDLLRDIADDLQLRVSDLRAHMLDPQTAPGRAALQRDIHLAAEIYSLLRDWLDAFDIAEAREGNLPAPSARWVQ